MSRAAIQIGVSTCLSGELDRQYKQAIYAYIRDYLRQCRASSARLKVRLDRFEANDAFAWSTISISGSVNGIHLNKTFARRRNLVGPSGGEGIAGVVAFFVIQSIAEIVNAATNRDPVQKKLTESLRECLADVRLLLDKKLGRSQSTTATAWSLLFWGRWLGTPVMFLLLFGIGILRGQQDEHDEKSFGLVLALMSLFGAIGFFGCVYLFTLVFMPANFFRNDSRGLKVLARTGVNNIWGMKLLAFGLGALAAMLFGGVTWVITCLQ